MIRGARSGKGRSGSSTRSPKALSAVIRGGFDLKLALFLEMGLMLLPVIGHHAKLKENGEWMVRTHNIQQMFIEILNMAALKQVLRIQQ